ncbi:hypothetical protein B8W90_13145, partial [Staphylococcus hominis]
SFLAHPPGTRQGFHALVGHAGAAAPARKRAAGRGGGGAGRDAEGKNGGVPLGIWNRRARHGQLHQPAVDAPRRHRAAR